jgi:hypothetical protein
MVEYNAFWKEGRKMTEYWDENSIGEYQADKRMAEY